VISFRISNSRLPFGVTTVTVSPTFFPIKLLPIGDVVEKLERQALKHKEKRDPESWKGMTFAVPFEISMQNLLLRYYLAEHGIEATVLNMHTLRPFDAEAFARALFSE